MHTNIFSINPKIPAQSMQDSQLKTSFQPPAKDPFPNIIGLKMDNISKKFRINDF